MTSPASQTTSVALLQIRCRNFLFAPVAQAARHRCRARSAQAGGLRFAAAFRHRFGEVGEQHREPEPDRQLRDEPAQGWLGGKNAHRRQRRADHGHKHDRVLDHQARIQFLERVADRRAEQCSSQKENEIVLSSIIELQKSFPPAG